MSIAEEANQLNAAGSQVENDAVGMVMAIDSVMEGIQGQVNQILGGTASNDELMGMFAQNKELRDQVVYHMKEMNLRMVAVSQRLMSGGGF